MKKLKLRGFIALLCALVTLFAAGCSGGSSGLGISPPLPWQYGEDCTQTETLEYLFKRYYGSDKADEPIVITTDDSKQKYELREGFRVDFNEDTFAYSPIADRDCTLLTMELTVKYFGDISVPELFRGKTETIKSAVVFSRYASNLTAVFMYKYIEYADAEKDGAMSKIHLYTDYTGLLTGAKKSVYIKNGEKEQKSVGGSDYFDNEMVLFLVRSFDSVKNGSNMEKSFKAAVSIDSFLYDRKFGNTSFIQRTASGLENISVTPEVYEFFDISADGDSQNEGDEEVNYSVPCYYTQISINSKKSGPPKSVYFASVSIKRNTAKRRSVEAKKVPVKLHDYLYDQNGQIEFTQVYELIDYSNSFKEGL